MLLAVLGKWFGMLWSLIGPTSSALITSFLSVLIGALPFIVIAAFASAILEVYVSPDTIARLVPKNGVLGVLLAPVLGFFIPMCDCGIVPVARRMVQKKVPASAAITFMLANPILNPLVIYATYLAFPFARQMVLWRLGLGYLVAVAAGLAMHFGLGPLRRDQILADGLASSGDGPDCDCGHDQGHHDHHHHHHGTAGSRLLACINHATGEFFDVMKYFIAAAAGATIAQQLIGREVLEAVGKGPVASVLVMILFAYLICTCSEADAFVAATFASTFSPGALVAFLVAGPMTDLKNTIMMLASFRKPFVIALNVLIISLTAAAAIGLNYALAWGRV